MMKKLFFALSLSLILVSIRNSWSQSGCNCLLPVDTSFTLAIPPSDDMSSARIDLPFSFNFYGQTADSAYINNNGNISFGISYAVFSSNLFPTSPERIIAPFHADVDTRDTAGGLADHGKVYYKLTPSALIVKWENVGYYDRQFDKLNTFQLIITNGSDSLIPNGNNVAFCYGDMQWTTGEASAGTNGFGGIPATAGICRGNGVDYFQLGTFDHPDTVYDGGYVTADGINFLDNRNILINTSLSTEIPPVALDDYCDTTFIVVNQMEEFIDYFMTPEISETNSTVTITPPSSGFNLINSTGGHSPMVNYSFIGTSFNIGLNHIEFDVGDGGAIVSHFERVIIVIDNTGTEGVDQAQHTLYPNPSNGLVTLQVPASLVGEKMVLTDALGKQIQTSIIQSQTEQFNLTTLDRGIYFITILNGQGNITKKLLKQ